MVKKNFILAGDETDSNLDLALKLLHFARSIVEKGQANTTEKVKILFALADVSLERGGFFFVSYSCI